MSGVFVGYMLTSTYVGASVPGTLVEVKGRPQGSVLWYLYILFESGSLIGLELCQAGYLASKLPGIWPSSQILPLLGFQAHTQHWAFLHGFW